MKSNTELLLDIINKRKKSLELLIEELDDSLDLMDSTKRYLYKNDLLQKKEIINFLNSLISNDEVSLDALKNYLKENKEDKFISVTKVSKIKIVKSLLKEYKLEYKKNHWNYRVIGIDGFFDNKLFCDIIRKRIDKFSYCNKVTRVKYKHLVAFLNEFLYEMENSKDPLKTLKHKIKLYERYRNNEYIEIRKQQKLKIDIIRELLIEYKKEKNLCKGCK